MNSCLTKRDKRAMNRIRKRNAELALLEDSELDPELKSIKDGIEEVKKQKLVVELMDGTSKSVENHLSFPSTSDSVHSGQLDLPGYARVLGEQVKEKLAEREKTKKFNNPEVVLQLYKLQGRTLGEHEIAAFLHRMMLGSNNCPKAGSDWIKFKGGKALQIVFIRINVGEDEMLHLSGTPFMQGYFKHWIKLKPGKTNRTRFWQIVSTVTRSKYEMLLHKIKTQGDPLLQINMSQRKPQMLMSLEQMVTSKFPFPSEYFGEQLCNGTIRSTRKIYHQVSETSPIFTLDCEMCQTTIQQLELTRISVVNEDGETVMDELVKPHNKIINYITFKSGITEKMLLNVFTRLKDIQHRLCTLLPADAILCGHSLENDLRALQLSHPYCIDTSLLFNFSGRLHIRSGLKALSKIFLNEDIQDSSKGHCSLQDALATWKLLKLKIEKGLQFGNVALGWKFGEWAKANGMSITGSKLDDGNLVNNGELKADDNCTSEIKEKESKEDDLKEDEPKKDELKKDEAKEEEPKDEEAKEEETKIDDKIEEVTTCVEAFVSDESLQNNSEGLFNFEEALRIENGMQFNTSLCECFHQINTGGKKYAKKMMVAMNNPNEFFSSNDCCKLVNLASPEVSSTTSSQPTDETTNLLSSCERISGELINFDYALVELNCPKGIAKLKMDQAFKILTNGICNNAFVLTMMCSGSRSILYEKIHKR
uniref:Exonuclease domain-containing protein n=1 Tax=Meloidogyne incognita TaxID=6306 RepID=A0A914L2Y2_MELIC